MRRETEFTVDLASSSSKADLTASVASSPCRPSESFVRGVLVIRVLRSGSHPGHSPVLSESSFRVVHPVANVSENGTGMRLRARENEEEKERKEEEAD